jgi:hypothetical protein
MLAPKLTAECKTLSSRAWRRALTAHSSFNIRLEVRQRMTDGCPRVLAGIAGSTALMLALALFMAHVHRCLLLALPVVAIFHAQEHSPRIERAGSGARSDRVDANTVRAPQHRLSDSDERARNQADSLVLMTASARQIGGELT